MTLLALDHVQLAMPRGREDDARAFYGAVLGLPELPKPPALAKRGGVWFGRLGGGAGGEPLQVHLGVEDDFRPAKKAHPAFLVDDLQTVLAACRAHGTPITEDDALEGYERAFVADPFGNRIELLEARRPI